MANCGEVRPGLRDCGSSLSNLARSGPLWVHIRLIVPGSAGGHDRNGIGVRKAKMLANPTDFRRPRDDRGLPGRAP